MEEPEKAVMAMVEFNPDGSLKLPSNLAKNIAEKEEKLKNGRCILIRKEIIDNKPPKKCALHIKLSNPINDNRFIEEAYKQLNSRAETPLKLIKLSEKEFKVEIGTSFRRCSECLSLAAALKRFVDVIEDSKACDFGERMEARFTEEDYFG